MSLLWLTPTVWVDPDEVVAIESGTGLTGLMLTLRGGARVWVEGDEGDLLSELRKSINVSVGR